MDKQTTDAGEVLVISDETYKQEVRQSDTPVLIDFMADWCRPCKIMDPLFHELAPEYAGKIKFVSINADDNPQTASDLGVLNLPTFILIQGDKVLAQQMGTMKPLAFRNWIEQGLQKASVAGRK